MLESIINDFFEYKTVKIYKDGSMDFKYKHNDKPIYKRELSLGEKKLLLMFVTALVVSDNDNAVLLYHNPENNLHIDWQRKLIDAIRKLNPTAKLLMTTYSPAILMDGYMDKVINMEDLLEKSKIQ